MDNNIINNDFNDFLKIRYENHTIEPESELWDGINARLYQKKVDKSLRKIRNLKISIFSVAMVLVAAFIYIEIKTDKYPPETQHESATVKTTDSSDISNGSILFINNTKGHKSDAINNVTGPSSNLHSGENKIKEIQLTNNQMRENKKFPSAQINVSAFFEKSEIPKGIKPNLSNLSEPITTLLPIKVSPSINNFVNLQTADSTEIKLASQKSGKDDLKLNKSNQNLTQSGELGTNRLGVKCSPFFIEGFISPEISYRALVANTQYSIPDYGKTYFNKKEKANFTFSTGVSGGLGITDNIVLKSGVFYSRYSLKFKTEAIHLLNKGSAGSLIYTSSGPVNFTLLSSDSLSEESFIKSSLNFSYLNIPLIAEFHFRNNCFLNLGLNFNTLVGQNMNWQAEDYNGDFSNTFGDPIDGLEKVSISMIVGFGTEKQISHNLSLIINPSVRISLSSINNTAPVKSYPCSWGLNAGLRYYIK